MDILTWLQNWYKSKCNGDWEHKYGIKIETLDNPGWTVSVDLVETDVRLADSPWVLENNSETDWLGYKVSDNVFMASGDPDKLERIIFLFKTLVDKA
jgi:hypothetical protein